MLGGCIQGVILTPWCMNELVWVFVPTFCVGEVLLLAQWNEFQLTYKAEAANKGNVNRPMIHPTSISFSLAVMPIGNTHCTCKCGVPQAEHHLNEP